MTKSLYAVVLVHGQGEQRPMRMGAEFVEHVLKADFDPASGPDRAGPRVRWRPEAKSGLDDVRRIEVRHADDNTPDLDIFEFYWAPMMAGNQLTHFQHWFFNVLRRPTRDLPKRVRIAKPVIIAGIWAALLALMFFVWLTAGALFPVQIIQLISHGPGDLMQFKLDLRLAVFITALTLGGAALASILRRHYGWCLSFCLSAALVCALAPTITSAASEIENDTYARSETGADLKFNIWGAPLVEVGDEKQAKPSALLKAAGGLTNWLCAPAEPDGEADTPSLFRTDVHTSKELQWADFDATGGIEANDLCAIPIALASPVVFARVADSGQILAVILLSTVGAMLFVLWRVYIRPFLVEVMGDSARYLNNHPENILARHEIRAAGMAMLTALHETKRYEKIAVVAHSLGTVVAYDVLRQYWGQCSDKITLPAGIVQKLAKTAKALQEAAPQARDTARDAWRETQAEASTAMNPTWLISDFITMGSPLAHGRLLLEGSPEAPHASARFACQRDVTLAAPACPPVTPFAAGRTLDSADLFAGVRWTNLFFDDDLVGGPVAEDTDGLLFGHGARDEGYKPGKLTVPGISHNSYWLSRLPADQSGQAGWLVSLRRLLDQPL
jgi:hypothetical protein